MDKNGMTYAEYYEIIKIELKKLNLIGQDLNQKNMFFSKCCTVKNDIVTLGFPKIQEILNDVRGKENLKKVLECVFGSDFFDDLTKEKQEESKKKNIFTKYDLDEDDFLGKVYGNRYNLEFKRPTSWDDMIIFLSNVFEVINNNFISDASKVTYRRVAFVFNRLIESTYANNLAESRETNFVSNNYNEFLSAIDEKRMVNIDEKTYPLIKNILNKDSRKFELLEDPKDKKIGFGDAFVMFCELYNNELEKVQKTISDNKTQSKIETKVNKYYKRIKNMSFNKLENKNFPKYNNENYVQIIKGIIDRFLKDLNEDEKWLPYYTVAQMHYASYFKTKYYDEDNFNKELENSCGGKNK